jgi:hypothetical protein
MYTKFTNMTNMRRFEGLMAMVDWIYAQPRGTCNEHTKEVFEETGEGDGGEAKYYKYE